MYKFLENFGTVFGQFGQDFWTEYWKFLELVSDSPGLGSGFVLIPGLMSSSFVEFFGIIEIC